MKIQKLTVFFFLCVLVCFCMHATTVSVRDGGDAKTIYVDLFLDDGELLHKEMLTITSDNSDLIIKKWEVSAPAYSEYLASFKQYKKVYKDMVTIAIELEREKSGYAKEAISITSFITQSDEKTKPFQVTVPLVAKERVAENVRAQNEHIPDKYVQKKSEMQNDGETPILKKKRFSPGKIQLFFSIISILLLILLLLLNVLSFADLMVLFLIGCWAIGSCYWLSYQLVLFSTSFVCTVSSAWFLVHARKKTGIISRVRLVIGIVCASAIVPLLVTMYLSGI